MDNSEIQRLKIENQNLKATIEGLQYENRMYKQLLDNLFLGKNQKSNFSTSISRYYIHSTFYIVHNVYSRQKLIINLKKKTCIRLLTGS